MDEIIAEGKTAKQLRKEREDRIHKTIALEVPDRVPIICGMGYFPGKYCKVPSSAAYYDHEAWLKAYRKTMLDYQSDLIFPQAPQPGKAMELLGLKTTKWPGYGVDEWKGHQAIEINAMASNEWDAYFKDPGSFLLTRFMPRVSDKLAGLAKLPPLSGLMGGGGAQMLGMAMADPDVETAIDTLRAYGREAMKFRDTMMTFNQMLLDTGNPIYFQGAAMPPFDIVSNQLRGMQGTMIDMYRNGDKILEACERIMNDSVSQPLPPPSENGYIRLFMTNTRGSDDFMSNKLFEKFYWPTVKKVINSRIELGGTMCIFFEGNFTSKLEYLLELPKGKFLVRLDTTDIYKAKDILKGHACIQGNVPSTILQTGTVDDVKAYCKKLIDDIGKDGGFILSPRSSTDEVKPENLKAMIDFTREYGVYN
jgi:uroporphyrinogen-III decarboxylase